ncbi:MAG: hypothetical protein JXB00_11855 [Bacteroidales bacterium]|nr:hypothetical protein [Bacteroidales bacterium]
MKQFFISFTFLLFCFLVSAQSDDERRVSGIISRESWENADGKTRYLTSVEKYDANGNKVEEIKYDKDKSIKKKIVCTYNSNNDKISETEYDESGKQVQKIIYEYNGNLRVTKKEYDEKNKLVSWKTYEYKYRP